MRQGRVVAAMPSGHPFDLYVSGYGRVEIKASRTREWQLFSWRFDAASTADRVSYLLSGARCDTLVCVESDGSFITQAHWLNPRDLPAKPRIALKDIAYVARTETLALPLVTQADLIRCHSAAIAAFAGSDRAMQH